VLAAFFIHGTNNCCAAFDLSFRSTVGHLKRKIQQRTRKVSVQLLAMLPLVSSMSVNVIPSFNLKRNTVVKKYALILLHF
jgi:hypothetical protein